MNIHDPVKNTHEAIVRSIIAKIKHLDGNPKRENKWLKCYVGIIMAPEGLNVNNEYYPNEATIYVYEDAGKREDKAFIFHSGSNEDQIELDKFIDEIGEENFIKYYMERIC